MICLIVSCHICSRFVWLVVKMNTMMIIVTQTAIRQIMLLLFTQL